MSNALQDELTELSEELGVVGVAAGVRHEGRDVYAFSGVTSVENPLQVDERTLFQFGSTAKTFTATMVMALVEQGRVGPGRAGTSPAAPTACTSAGGSRPGWSPLPLRDRRGEPQGRDGSKGRPPRGVNGAATRARW